MYSVSTPAMYSKCILLTILSMISILWIVCNNSIITRERSQHFLSHQQSLTDSSSVSTTIFKRWLKVQEKMVEKMKGVCDVYWDLNYLRPRPRSILYIPQHSLLTCLNNKVSNHLYSNQDWHGRTFCGETKKFRHFWILYNGPKKSLKRWF